MVDEPKGAGRPEFKATKARRATVMRNVACGASHEEIAAVLGCSRNTLEKWFAHELATGKAVKREENYARIEEAAAGGNVAAMRLWQQCLDGSVTGPGREAVGKKEAARAAARNPEPGTPLGDLMRKRQQQQQQQAPVERQQGESVESILGLKH